ncbi:MAG TPA: WYL domain-containing protein [Frateuria sp.]|uniref:helix-turn-helix transcriptional regulator n=1 Tax=Frateuria sp. TaxID=2211372 RepID=UPI002D7FF729|nr:WYL domain-containing protein [Frateuria sp.]HET6804003.1 WYL domain-containing protein [Frateuria sp.]
MKNKAIDKPTARRGRWGQDRRLEFIDHRLTWEGRLNRTALTEFFGISIPQASLDLARYMELAPGNTEYDLSQKTYVALPTFRPLFVDASSGRYLAELYALTTGVLLPDVSFIGSAPPADVVRHPTRTVAAPHLRLALMAIREGRQLVISYQAVSRPEPTERVVSPTVFAYDGYRWHMRGYCHLRNGYRDFVFARILSMTIGDRSDRTLAQDEAWHRMLDVVIAPHPSLAEGPRRAIALDYGMEDDQLTVPTRQALAYYLLKRLGLATPSALPATEQQIVLVNREDLIPYVPQLAHQAG